MTFNNVTLGTPGAHNQIFVARYNDQGALQWAGRAGGGAGAPYYSGNANFGTGVALDPSGAALVTGDYGGRADFGPFLLDSTATRRPSMFLAKIGGTVRLGVAPAQETARRLAVAPNPAAGGPVAVVLSHPTRRPTELRLLNAVGQVVLRQTLPAGTSTATLATAGLKAGLYRVQLLAEKPVSCPLMVQ